MDCQQCQAPIENIFNHGNEGKWCVGWCGKDIHMDCLPLHVRSCRACWPHNTGYILRADQRIAADASVREKNK